MTYDPVAKRSRILFHWRAADLDTEPITGQIATFTRAGTSTVPDDNAGASYTAANQQPAWHYSTSVAEPTLRMQATPGDELYWSYAAAPQTLTAYVSFVEQGGAAQVNASALHMGATGATDPEFTIDSSGTYYRVTHDNNVDAAVVATLSTAPSANQGVELRAVLNADGSVIIGQSVNGAAETTASNASTATHAAAWSAAELHVNGRGGIYDDDYDYRVIKVAPGVKTMAQMRTIF